MRYTSFNPPYKPNQPCDWVKKRPAVLENQMRLQISQNGFCYVTGYVTYDEAEKEYNRLVKQGATGL